MCMEIQKKLNEECAYYKEVPRSLISDYEKFFNFILPKNADNKDIIITVPEGIFYEIGEIRESLRKIRSFKSITIIMGKTSKISICIK